MTGTQEAPKLLTIETRLPPETVERLKDEAEKQRRSVASLVRVTIEEMLEAA